MSRTASVLSSALREVGSVTGWLSILLETQRDLRREDVRRVARQLRQTADRLEELL